MNYKQLKQLYKKEIMDVLRDKKTILTMVVLPIILYPLLFLIIMQVLTVIQTSQKEQTYLLAYENVAEEQQKELNQWILGDEDGLDYSFKCVDSENPQKELEDETIDTYVTSKEIDGQIVYEIHYLSAISNSNTASTYLKEEIDAYSNHLAEENLKEKGLEVKATLHPVKATYKDHSSSESSIGSILGGIIPFLMITAILMGAMYPAIDATAGEKERGTLETLLTLPIGNMELIMSKFLSVATIAVVSVFINVISMGIVAMYLYTTISALSDGLGSFHLSSFLPAALISVVCVIVFALFMSALVMCVCAFANICLLMKNLLIFKYDLSVILIVLFSNMIYAFVAVWFLGRVYNSESILFGESVSGIKLFERRKNIKKGSVPTIQEGLLILVVALLLMMYAGGVVSVKNMTVGIILQQVFIGALPILACLYIKGDMKKVFGLRFPKPKHLLGSVCMYLGVGSFVMFLSNLSSFIFKESGVDLSNEYDQILDGVPFLGGLLLMALLPAFMEELLFRGYLYTAFKSKLKYVPAMVCVSLLFGLSHMSLIKLIPTAVLGCALFYVRDRSDSIVASSLLHFLNNAVAIGILYYGERISFLNDASYGVPLMIGMVVCSIIFTPIGMLCLKPKKQLM